MKSNYEIDFSPKDNLSLDVFMDKIKKLSPYPKCFYAFMMDDFIAKENPIIAAKALAYHFSTINLSFMESNIKNCSPLCMEWLKELEDAELIKVNYFN